MIYEYKPVPDGMDVLWIRLIKPYKGNHNSLFPKTLNVGDITWVREECWGLMDNTHIEENRYFGNFEQEYFELVDKPNLNYEIY